MSPTIYDIARVAGVSKSTVSRVLNKQTNISPEAREKVLRAIEELQYQPNKLARALTSSGFDAIMVISTRSTKTTAGNPFFSEVLHAITAKAEEEGFDVILQTSHNLAEDLQKCESKIKQKMIKGIIMLSSPADESFFAQLDKYDIPVVVIGKVEGQYAHVYSVDTDNFGDSIALTDALIESGHQILPACMLRLMSMFRLTALMAISKVWLRIILQCVMNGLLTAVIPMKQPCKPHGNY
ncbi:transcriptional regulator YcjW [Escherichia coli]|nr:transcriptional regulator YcjW [Escherichia coli]